MCKPKNRIFFYFFFFPEKFPPSDLTQDLMLEGKSVPSCAAGKHSETCNLRM